MGATNQEIAAIKITIQDSRKCQTWDQIRPLLRELFNLVSTYNKVSYDIMEPSDLTQSGVHATQPIDILQHVKKIEASIGKLHGKGVHFVDLGSFDVFCKAFDQAMVCEFGEDEMRVAAY